MEDLIGLSGNRVWADDIEATGTTGVIVHVNEKCVHKISKLWSPSKTASKEERRNTDHQNKAKQRSFEMETEVHRRLIGPHQRSRRQLAT